MSLVKRIFGEERGARRSPGDYIDLTDYTPPEGSGPALERETFIRVAEIHRPEEVRDLMSLVFDGNILLLDIKKIQSDEIVLRRVTSEIRRVVQDVEGDVVGIGDSLLVVTPRGVRVDRRKLKIEA